MLGPTASAVGRPLREVLALQDQDGATGGPRTCRTTAWPAGSAFTEQSWFTADGDEVLVTGRIIRDAPRRPGRAGSRVVLRSARGRARLDRDRSDLVATVAHELRSPLTGVKGFVTTLLNKWDLLNDDQKKLMLDHRRTPTPSGSRRLITELLDVARIDTGRLPLYPRPVDTATLVERCVDSAPGRHQPRRSRSSYADEPAAVHRRPRQAHPGRHQPGRQRDPPRRGHGRGDRSTPVTDAVRRGAPPSSTTRARASPRRSAPGCSPSSGSTASAAAPAWGCTSSTAWSACTAARSRSATRRPAAPGRRAAGPRSRPAQPEPTIPDSRPGAPATS